MGLKDAAKALMIKAGVPVVPGYHGADQDDALLASEADKIGYPVLIKAVAGGGGKGMRLVEAADGFHAALDSARSEAKTAFGNADVLVEKFVTKPRQQPRQSAMPVQAQSNSSSTALAGCRQTGSFSWR